jgi:hypothetical protein
MPAQHFAVINQSKFVTPADLAKWSDAVNKQLARDFFPIWQRTTTCAAFPDEASVPVGHWKVFIADDIHEPGAAGYHTDEHHQPVAYVQYDRSGGTSVTLSHEVLEAAVDPFGNRMLPVDLPKYGRVRMLVEICDPPEALSYSVNGVQVSDFITPEWYDPAPTGIRYSFLNKIARPKTILKGGYCSFLTADGNWHQQTWFSGNAPRNAKLGRRTENVPLRQWIDARTQPH